MKNKTIDADMLLRSAMRSTETPDPELVQKIKYILIKEEPIMKKFSFKRSFGMVAAAVIMTLTLITATAFAAQYLLKPSDISDKFDDSALSAAFKGDGAININKSVVSGDYKFTLLGIVSGKDISDYQSFSDGVLRDDRTYAVTAIERADGSPMPSSQDDDYGDPSFYVSPYVKGLKPWDVNAHTLNGGYSEVVIDGIMYRILECDEITMFADRGVYLGINTGSSYTSQAFIYDEQTGELKVNPDYTGSSVIFDLPLDVTLASPEKAQTYLDTIIYPERAPRDSGEDIPEIGAAIIEADANFAVELTEVVH